MQLDDAAIEEVIGFLADLQNAIFAPNDDIYNSLDENDARIKALYENEWNRITEKYFKTEPWPEVSELEEYGLEFDRMFTCLYLELYYRHVFNIQGTINRNNKDNNNSQKTMISDDLKELLAFKKYNSWKNYCEIFKALISCEEPPKWTIPGTWLWDIMDEFLYQFNQFRTFRSKMQSKTEQELEYLHEIESQSTWCIHSVLNILYSLVGKSCIVESLQQLSASGGARRLDTGDNEFADNEMYKYLGFFSLIALLKLYVLTGDYELAIKTMEKDPIDMLYDLDEQEWFITTVYYYGFALMMKRKYKEAISRFQSVLLFVERSNRNNQQRQVAYKNEQQNKIIDNIYHLLAVCVTLYPIQLDGFIESKMKNEKLGKDKFIRLQSADVKLYEEIFNKAGPKFVPLSEPELTSSENKHFSNTNLQKKVFMDEVRSQLQLPAIRRYLKLYTTMKLSKLSSFLKKAPGASSSGLNGIESQTKDSSEQNMDEATLSYLMCSKVKMAVASGENFDETCASSTVIVNSDNPIVKKKVSEDDKDGKTTSTEDEVEDDVGPNVDYYVDNDMVYIADFKIDKSYGNRYIQLIESFRNIEATAKRISKTKLLNH